MTLSCAALGTGYTVFWVYLILILYCTGYRVYCVLGIPDIDLVLYWVLGILCAGYTWYWV